MNNQANLSSKPDNNSLFSTSSLANSKYRCFLKIIKNIFISKKLIKKSKYRAFFRLQRKALLELLLKGFDLNFQYKIRVFLQISLFSINFSFIFILFEYILLKLKIKYLQFLRESLFFYCINKTHTVIVFFDTFLFQNVANFVIKVLSVFGQQKLYFSLIFNKDKYIIFSNFKMQFFYYQITTNKFFISFLTIIVGVQFMISLLNTIFILLAFLRLVFVLFQHFNKLKKKQKFNKILLLNFIINFCFFLVEIARLGLSYKLFFHFFSCFFFNKNIIIGG